MNAGTPQQAADAILERHKSAPFAQWAAISVNAACILGAVGYAMTQGQGRQF
jgi:uncharacterized protein HemX